MARTSDEDPDRDGTGGYAEGVGEGSDASDHRTVFLDGFEVEGQVVQAAPEHEPMHERANVADNCSLGSEYRHRDDGICGDMFLIKSKHDETSGPNYHRDKRVDGVPGIYHPAPGGRNEERCRASNQEEGANIVNLP